MTARLWRIGCKNHVALLLLILIVTSLLGVHNSSAQQPLNRQPKPDEAGYRPADGATVELNPPSLVWLRNVAEAEEKTEFSYVAKVALLAEGGG